MKQYFDKVFFKSALSIALPIIVLQLVTSLAQLIDNIMVGTINGQAIAGVGAANSILLVVMSSTFGICGGASIFIAQQYGANDPKKMGNSLAISISIIVGLAVVALTFINVFDQRLLSIYIHGSDPSSVAATQYGMEYLNIMVWGYWLLMFNAVIGSLFRAIGKTKVPMKAGIVAVVSNTILNFLLIPKFGVQGAAFATVTSRVIEFVILYYCLKYKQTVMTFNIECFKTVKIAQFKQMIAKMIPLATNEFLWGLGTSTIMALYGSRSIIDLASAQITYTIGNILFIGFSGFGVATSVLIGQKLGNNEFDLAVENSKKLLTLGLTVGLIFTVFAQLLAFAIPILYGNVEPVIQVQAENLLRIIGLIYPVSVITVSLFFILRAGGDTLGVLIMDSGTMWCLVIPVGFLLVKYTSIPLYGIFISVQSFEIVKMLFGFYRYRSYNWVKNIA